MFTKNNRTTILDSQMLDGVKFGDGVIIEPNAVIYEGCEIGDHVIIGAGAILRPRTVIGHHSIFGTLSVSEGDNYIGCHTTIHAQCHITSKMKIMDNVFIAPFFIASNTVNITTGKHGTEPDMKPDLKSGEIESNVRIGINVSMIPGIKIGENSLIYQNCLITKDIPKNSIVKAGKDQIGRVVGNVT